MTTYAIGDIQGCFKPFQQLLDKINFNPKMDSLWLTGDLINRGSQSLETLRFIKKLDDDVNNDNKKSKIITVMGNHDLTLLAVAYGAIPYNPQHHTFEDILNAPDKEELIDWLRHRPFIHHDPHLNYTLVHAGLYPNWTFEECILYGQEVEYFLQNKDHSKLKELLKNIYGNEPSTWDPHLKGWERLRFFVNVFTRMRFCNTDGKLDLVTKESKTHPEKDFLPWFEISPRKTENLNIIFGHWAALKGKAAIKNIFPIDTGCVWGGCLTAMRLEDQKLFQVNCNETNNTL